MRLISTTKCSSVLSLLGQGYSHCQIHDRTGVGMGTISKIGREVNTNNENNSGGRPAKLSAYDKQSILHQITSGKLDNAVQATNFINSTLPRPVHPQTVRNALKEAGYTLLQRRKHLCLSSSIVKSGSNLHDTMKTGLWRIGKECCSHD